jgi:hypothetical protein
VSTPFIALDLAAKFSAGCEIGSDGEVVNQWHSWQSSAFKFAEKVALEFSGLKKSDDSLLVIEDLPFAIGQTKTVRDVYRLQGIIIYLVTQYGMEDRIVFIPPMLWQHWLKPEGVKKGDKKAIKLVADQKYSYLPPELVHKDLHGKDRVDARKTMEDYVDAFMISRYILSVGEEYGSITAAIENIPRLERYSSGS